MKKTLLYWLPVFLWMGIIFYASSQPYEKQDLRPTISANIDLSIIETLFSTVKLHYAGDEISIEALGAAHFLEFFIRKAAHFFTYFVLGFLMYRGLNHYFLNNRLTSLISWFLTILYAISDEVHQGFTPNRSPHIEDVMIDATGGLVGILLALIIYKKIRTKRI
ncbi:VanZ family protein [Fictibacillus norfolkensis]|uniref:VanZ family protein n=1 Tax=Fictibacillus norfolkensis TaxID=2762233 RepID=A0ABR8SI80_9BACL|nr:VanZ family protein [Fictibacillus norfolkensis]MBD7963202.1 VanZ family protein [Fictibacillus norfolkensis]